MDLLAILRTLWRFKLASLLVIILTGAGCGAVVFLVTPVWAATSSYVLINPPAPPTDAELAADPKLSKINYSNPYLRFSDQSVVINILARRVNTDATRAVLVAEGADTRYQVVPSARFGFSSPIIDVQIEAPTAAVVARTSELVGREVVSQLHTLQAAEGTDARYMITVRAVEATDDPKVKTSGMMRSLIGVIALGTFVLLVMVSSLQAWDRSRAERVAAKAARREADGGTPGGGKAADNGATAPETAVVKT
jgi:hypothetical protein